MNIVIPTIPNINKEAIPEYNTKPIVSPKIIKYYKRPQTAVVNKRVIKPSSINFQEYFPLPFTEESTFMGKYGKLCLHAKTNSQLYNKSPTNKLKSQINIRSTMLSAASSKDITKRMSEIKDIIEKEAHRLSDNRIIRFNINARLTSSACGSPLKKGNSSNKCPKPLIHIRNAKVREYSLYKRDIHLIRDKNE